MVSKSDQIPLAAAILQIIFVLFPLWVAGAAYFVRNKDTLTEGIKYNGVVIGLSVGSPAILFSFTSLGRFVHLASSNLLSASIDVLVIVFVIGMTVVLMMLYSVDAIDRSPQPQGLEDHIYRGKNKWQKVIFFFRYGSDIQRITVLSTIANLIIGSDYIYEAISNYNLW